MAAPSPRGVQPVDHAVDPGALSEAHIVAALASGAHAAALTHYFGEREYPELTRLARRALKAAARKTGVRVYVLPGIMGSTLGIHTKDTVRPLWLHPHAIAQGSLAALSLPSNTTVTANGVLLPGYLKLKLHLQAAGFDAVLHPFDWRKSVIDSGHELARRIAQDDAHICHLVGHSMGGLVARAALARDTRKRIAKVVQLGAPNFGSFALVQALRGVYPTVRKLAALDNEHSCDQLVRHVFRTLPGLYEMLPASSRTTDLDFTSLGSWPSDLLGPDATLLNNSVRMRARLASSRSGCFHIVGVGHQTVTRARLRHNEFQYGITDDGDGTVPRTLAEWPGAACYYVREHHGLLTRNETVCRAIIDLLARDTTRRLDQTHTPSVASTIRWQGDVDLRRGNVGGKQGKVQWEQLPINERRQFLDPSISDLFRSLAS